MNRGLERPGRGSQNVFVEFCGALEGSGKHKPMSMQGQQFNAKAERYYGQTLKKAHVSQGFDLLGKAFEQIDLWARYRDS